jgi:hypothetical protein
MDGITPTPRRKPASRLLGQGLHAIGVGLSAPGLATAAPIRSAREIAEALLARETAHTRAVHDAAVAHPGIFKSWSAYLLGGPSVWSTLVHPPVSRSVETAIWHALKTDPPRDANPWIEFLVWKRHLDQARFDHFHPNVARALEKLAPPQTGPQLASPPPSTPGSGTTTPPLQGQQIGPNPVPEPASWLLAVGITGWGLWWRRRAR